MADQSSQEKTEQPTPKRLREARKKGQVFKSKDLEAAFVFLAAFGGLFFFQSFISSELRSYMEDVFRSVGQNQFTLEDISRLSAQGFITLVKVCAPILLICAIVAFLAGFLQVGAIFSLEPLKPQMKRLDAVENLKNMLKPKIFIELFKNVLKMAVVFIIAYSVLKGMLEPFLMTVGVPLEGSYRLGGMVMVKFLIRFLIFFLALAAFDLYLQRREYIQNLKMTKEEVKREYKEDEGDPLIKGQRRQIHMEMVMGDVKQRVQSADAVITNPTHLAVAIRYDKKDMMAPQVVAKGQRLFAEYIKELAQEYKVPIVRNVPLAWALIELEMDDEIPEKLYTAVAEILTFVYRLKEEKP